MFAATAHAASTLPGAYDGGQTELTTGLVLKPDGQFQYMLSYGALDEHAAGRWSERDGKVLLTTEPRPRPPRFAVVSDAPSPDGKLYVSLDKPEALGGFSLTVRARYPGSERDAFIEADEDGAVPLPAAGMPAAIVPDLPIYDVALDHYPLAPGGHRIVFRFEPNDLGVADFRDEALTIDAGALVIKRYDRTIRFEKAEH